MTTKIFWKIIFFEIFISLGVSSQASVSAGSCAAGWTDKAPLFETAVEYDDVKNKANPTVQVVINGKPAKMMLDTGANMSLLWDPSLLDEIPDSESQRIDSHMSFTEGKRVEATLEDDHGNASRQAFYLIGSSVLEKYGYSGILSPQAIAAENAILLDFERNCFFFSPSFEIGSSNDLDVYRGSTIRNPFGVMTIPIELDGGKIPVVVDTGSSVTTILASLLVSKPLGKGSARWVDMFGAESSGREAMRLVDLRVNGKIFKALPVDSRPHINERGVLDFGYIGMDILKNSVIYHDGARQEFTLMTRRKKPKITVK